MSIMRMHKKYGVYLKEKKLVNMTTCMLKVIHLLLTDIFENFGKKCVETYKLDPIYSVSAPVLTWQACLKKK